MIFFGLFLLILVQSGLSRGIPIHRQFDGKHYEYLKQRFGLTEEELQRLVRTVKNELRQALVEKYDNEQDIFNYDEMGEPKMQEGEMATKYVEKNQVKKMDDIIHGEKKMDQKIRRQKAGPDVQKMSVEHARLQPNKVFNGYRFSDDNQPLRSKPMFENPNKASKKNKAGPKSVEVTQSAKNAGEKRKPIDTREESIYLDEEGEDQPFSYYINPDVQYNHEQAKRDSQCSKADTSSHGEVNKMQNNAANVKKVTRHDSNMGEEGDKKAAPQKGVFAPVKITKYVNNGGGYEEAGEYIVDLPAGLLNTAEKSEIQKLSDNIKYDK